MALPINILIICAKNEEQAEFAEIVQLAGMRSICCAYLQEARNILSRQDIHAVITGENLPDGSYQDVIHQRGRDSEELPVIVFSNSCDWDQYLRMMRSGAFDSIVYPPDSTEVARILRQAIRRAKERSGMAVTAA